MEGGWATWALMSMVLWRTLEEAACEFKWEVMDKEPPGTKPDKTAPLEEAAALGNGPLGIS